MSEPMDSFEPVTAKGRWHHSPKAGRWLRATKWLLLGLVFVFAIAYLHTAIYGTQAVREAIRGEAVAGYRDLKARAPGMVHPSFGGPDIAACRAIFPGLIRCSYSLHYGNEAAAGYVDFFLWNGRVCKRLRQEGQWVS